MLTKSDSIRRYRFPMIQPNFVILFVANPPDSAAFYSGLLGKQPVENSATFAMFILDNGWKLGLWAKHNVEPAATVTGGGTEVVFTVGSYDAVREACAEWTARGLPIAQPVTQMDFGLTFVALDPDGHRLRVFARPPA